MPTRCMYMCTPLKAPEPCTVPITTHKFTQPEHSSKPSHGERHHATARCRSTSHGFQPRGTEVQRLTCCKATGGGGRVVDRRDVLLGLAGAATAAGLATTTSRGGGGAPAAPDLGTCHPADLPETAAPDVSCCGLTHRSGTAVVDFEPPPPASSPLRVRPAAHLVDEEYVAKYERAVALMKELPDDDPRSFEQQWRVHCAYCDGAYDQGAGFPDLGLRIHNCWLFFPWHRWFLYFHERILGKLIGDDTFALPFWNWDAPGGMTLPAIYANKSSPLYDERRNPAHQPPLTLDLDYNGCDDDSTTIPREQQIDQNLRIMYRQMISGAKKTELFLGRPYRAGDAPNPGAGTIETVPHARLHRWVGDPRQPSLEDMGKFCSAARDPVFFAHHANIDRLWHVWRGLRRPAGNGNNTGGFTDADWLDAAFLFYDEDARLVRARVRDCLDAAAALRYAYQDVALPWLNARPPATYPGSPAAPATGALPATLDQTVRVAVARPRISRSCREKEEEEEEVLVVEGVEVAGDSKFVKFDVFVNLSRRGQATAAAAEFAGSVALALDAARRPGKGKSAMRRTSARFGIGDLLEDIGADGDRTLVVSLVPRCAGETVTVGVVRIEYVK